jgi:Helix-turn-helix domain
MAEMGRIMTHSKDRRRLATVSDAHALAQFLLVRRRAVQPADVGLPTTGRRRVAGLRRDEVARLAGISVAYYQRLEQARGRRGEMTTAFAHREQGRRPMAGPRQLVHEICTRVVGPRS